MSDSEPTTCYVGISLPVSESALNLLTH